MALLQVHYLSDALKRIVTFHIFLPNDVQDEFKKGNPHYDRPVRTLYLLHGYSGNTTDWVSGSDTMEMSRKYNLAIVMPSGENSFYIDREATGQAYETYIAKELPDYVSSVFGLSKEKEDIMIGGLSMGGFGAIRLGLKYPEKYSAVFGFSSALIIDEISRLTPRSEDGFALQLANYAYYRDIFGELSEVADGDKNPEYLVKQNIAKGRENPPIFMACGTEDALLENNRKFRDFLVKHGVNVTYHESRGIHNWKFWNEYLEPAICWALDKRVCKKKGA